MIDKLQTGRRIAILRRKLGLSQSALAEKLNLTTQAVSKWETGLALPDTETLMELSWLFEIPVNSILEGGEGFADSAAMTRAKLPEQTENLLKTKEEKKLAAALVPYFSEVELTEIVRQIATGSLSLSLAAEVVFRDERRKVDIALQSLSEHTLRELAPGISEAANIAVGDIPLPVKRVSEYFVCPECGAKMELLREGDSVTFVCPQKHQAKAKIVDGVICFDTREIPGELWSLSLRNYDHYLEWQNSPHNPSYDRGLDSGEVIWEQIEKRKPKVILDIATGMGDGVKRYLQKIDWPCMLILTDLSYRILSWDKRYFETAKANPFIDLVYLACDCAHIPIQSESVDLVLSCCGFESMQEKKMQGFAEANRILKKGAYAVYDMCTVEDPKGANTKKWSELIASLGCFSEKEMTEQLVDLETWLIKCREYGFKETDCTKIFGELPAPETDVFPFENEIMQWMCSYVLISKK